MRYVDPIERQIAAARQPGRVVEDRRRVKFRRGPEDVAEALRALVEAGDAPRAMPLYEALVAGLYEKIDPVNGLREVDLDLVGRLSEFGERLVKDWLRARHEARATPDETACRIVATIEGFTAHLVGNLDDADLASVRVALSARLDELAAFSEELETPEHVRLVRALGAVHLAHGDADA